MSGVFFLREPVPWSLRRLSVFRQCRRRWFLQYLLPVSDPLSTQDKALQGAVSEFLRENPPPIHWVSNILASADRFIAESPVCTPEMLELQCLRDLNHRSMLPHMRIKHRVRQLRNAGWFMHVAARVTEFPLTFLPVKQIETFPVENLSVLMLPAVIFIEGSVAAAMRPALPVSETDLIADALQTMFIKHKVGTVKEVRIRKLIFTTDPEVPPEWRESVLSSAELRIARELIYEFADEMSLNSRSLPFSEHDFPVDGTRQHCQYCPFQHLFCAFGS